MRNKSNTANVGGPKEVGLLEFLWREDGNYTHEKGGGAQKRKGTPESSVGSLLHHFFASLGGGGSSVRGMGGMSEKGNPKKELRTGGVTHVERARKPGRKLRVSGLWSGDCEEGKIGKRFRLGVKRRKAR